MIPKIIHYCWFGDKEMPSRERLCIQSWKKYFPTYKFIKWNEQNFDINSSIFCKQAYEMKMYAFVSDYVRTKVLYEYGGIYFDTDYEVLKSFDFLDKSNKNTLGWENRSNIGTAFMAFEAKHPIMKLFLDYYNTHSFIDSKGRMDNTANVSILTDILIEEGIKCDRSLQSIKDLMVYPRDYFYPKRIEENEFRLFENTYGVHHYSMSWLTERQKRRGNNVFWIKVARPILKRSRTLFKNILGKEFVRTLEIRIRNFIN